jgi:hypothetical protein
MAAIIALLVRAGCHDRNPPAKDKGAPIGTPLEIFA